jgi:hypothetical protein
VYRIHAAGRGAWFFRAGGAGRFNLRSPRGTCYAARSPLGAFVEVFGDLGRIPKGEVDGKRLSGLVLPRAFRLADATQRAALGHGVTLELSAGVQAGEPYAHTQPWAEAFADAGFDGVQYHCRHDPAAGEIAYALFDAEGERDWPLAEPGSTEIRQELVESAREHYSLIVLPEP